MQGKRGLEFKSDKSTIFRHLESPFPKKTTDCLLDQYGLLKLTEEQFNQVDHNYFIKTRKENYGYTALTNQKQFYQENYPEIIIEKNNFDTLFSMMLRGE